MELEHAIGFSGYAKSGLHTHPDGEHVIYAQGGCVVIASLRDAHTQSFLRGHDDRCQCVAWHPQACTPSAPNIQLASGSANSPRGSPLWEDCRALDS